MECCPLCGSTEGTVQLRIAYQAIWKALATCWGVEISGEVRIRNEPAPEATLIACGSCGLQYFSPLAPGDIGFYEQLMAAIPYNDDRWDFGVVARHLTSESSVVDLGCGDGAFVRRIADHVDRATGVDHNRVAIGVLRAQGFDAYAEGFTEFSERERGAFDTVCAFHVLEHLPSAEQLIQPAKRCARPGGNIFISVPNRHRIGQLQIEPLDCPPHHVSRWAAEQLRTLGELHGLILVGIGFERIHAARALVRLLRGASAKADARREALETLAKISGSSARLMTDALRRPWSLLRMAGHSMLVHYRTEGSGS